MAKRFDPAALIPSGVVLESVEEAETGTVITVRPAASAVECSACGSTSHRMHSRYKRTLADLPLSGRPVQLKLLVRRFRCDWAVCSRRIFTERLDAAAPWARRTAMLDDIVHHLGLAFGVPQRALPGGSGSPRRPSSRNGRIGSVETIQIAKC